MSHRTAAVLALLATTLAAVLAGPATPASAAATGLWRSTCGYAGSAADDPIALPGRPGAAQLHDFFGNRSVGAGATYASMSGKASTCPQRDRSAYWTPALYRNGLKVMPAGMTTQYTNSVSPGEAGIEPFPPGFKIITGDARNTDPAAVTEHIRWGCAGGTQFGPAVPATCASGGIQLRITFPSCWNGRTRPGNAARNLRYPAAGACPTGFSRALPTLRISVSYPTGPDVGAITLASGPVSSVHASFWNTWDQTRLTQLVQQCLRATRQCPHFTGITAGVPPRTLLGAGPPLAPTTIPDPGDADATAPDATTPGAADPDGADPDGADPDGTDPGAADPGDADGTDPGGKQGDGGGPAVSRPAGDTGRRPAAPEPSAQAAPGGSATDRAEPDPRRTAVDTPTIAAPPWTRRRTQVGDGQPGDRPGAGKQQTWTFAAGQEPPVWIGLAAVGVALLCLIGGGLLLAQRRRVGSGTAR